MLSYQIEPRRSETNATGHIDHAVIPVWFENARSPIYELFNPGLSFRTWNTVIRKMDIEYLGQIFHDKNTVVRTSVGNIRDTSFEIIQELWQESKLTATATTVIVHFDYDAKTKITIPGPVKEKLSLLQKP